MNEEELSKAIAKTMIYGFDHGITADQMALALIAGFGHDACLAGGAAAKSIVTDRLKEEAETMYSRNR